MKIWLRILIVTLAIGFGKAHHIIRLIILAGLGLAGLWMLHTLAQDFQKIFNKFQQSAPIPKFLLKRSINETYHPAKNIKGLQQQNFNLEWEEILSRDPVGCARSFICQLVATNPKELTIQSTNILLLIKSIHNKENWANKEFQNALVYGKQIRNPTDCLIKYKLCPYSIKVMIQILTFFGGT